MTCVSWGRAAVEASGRSWILSAVVALCPLGLLLREQPGLRPESEGLQRAAGPALGTSLHFQPLWESWTLTSVPSGQQTVILRVLSHRDEDHGEE